MVIEPTLKLIRLGEVYLGEVDTVYPEIPPDFLMHDAMVLQPKLLLHRRFTKPHQRVIGQYDRRALRRECRDVVQVLARVADQPPPEPRPIAEQHDIRDEFAAHCGCPHSDFSMCSIATALSAKLATVAVIVAPMNLP